MSALNVRNVYLFDLDGTLADSMPVAVKIVLSLLDEKGISYSSDIVKTLTPLGFKGIARYYAETLGVPLTPEEIFTWFMQKLERAYAEQIDLKAGAEETVRALKARGERLCVLTGSPHLFLDACLKRANVTDCFERIWSAEDFGLLKSDVRLYERVAKALEVPMSALTLVDDGINVLKTARKAGLKTVGVYDEYSADAEEEIRSFADRYVHSLTEML